MLPDVERGTVDISIDKLPWRYSRDASLRVDLDPLITTLKAGGDGETAGSVVVRSDYVFRKTQVSQLSPWIGCTS